jgi:hypothetical protein
MGIVGIGWPIEARTFSSTFGFQSGTAFLV